MIFSKNLSGFPQQEDPRKQGVILLESGMHAGRAACTICIWPACRPNLHLSSILVSHPSMKSTLHCLCFWDPSILNKVFNLFRQRTLKGISEKALIRKKKSWYVLKNHHEVPGLEISASAYSKVQPEVKWKRESLQNLSVHKQGLDISIWLGKQYNTRVRKMCCSKQVP